MYNNLSRGNGWDFQVGKSVNAVEEETNNNYTATDIASLIGISVKAVKAFFEPVAWHHSSKFFNEIDYFSLSEIEGKLKQPELKEQIKAFDTPEFNSEVRHSVIKQLIV